MLQQTRVREPRPRRLPVAVAGGVLALVAGAAAVFLAVRDGGSRAPVPGEPAVPADALAGPGTELPDGMEVAPGSSLVGPAVVDRVAPPGDPASWFAILAVEGDPLAVWRAYAGQLARMFPGDHIDAARAPGCRAPGAGPAGEVCVLSADEVDGGQRRTARLSMSSVPGDVTGTYLLHIEVAVRPASGIGDLREGGGDPWPGGELPEPRPPRPRPGVGGPLAPATVAYEGDEERYVLLEGSELIAQYGGGSLTGGFGVLLRTTPGADLDAVAEAYADQANQIDGEPVPPPDVVGYGGTTVTVYRPPGGAGGYSGTVYAVDAPDGSGFIVYELTND